MTALSLSRMGTHALAWALFITYELSILLVTATPERVHWWEYVGYYGLNISLFYLNAHLVLATAFSPGRSAWLLLLFVPLALCGYLLLQYALEHFYDLLRGVPKNVRLNHKFILGFVWRGSYFIGLSTAYWFVQRTMQHHRTITRLQLAQLQAQRAHAELEKNLVVSQNAYLQAQINPHFLFNTLNFIYNAVQEVAPRASEGVLLLSEVMHHALARVHADGKTDLLHEVQNIQKYIALNQLRFQRPLHLQVHVTGPLEGQRIPPLVLLTFVENLFSHGDLTDADHPARISVVGSSQGLCFETSNRKRGSALCRGHGLGIQNARTRLQDFYGTQGFALDIRDEALSYHVHLQLTFS